MEQNTVNQLMCMSSDSYVPVRMCVRNITSASLINMSSGRGSIDGPEAARILSAPRGGRLFVVCVKARMPLSDLQVLRNE